MAQVEVLVSGLKKSLKVHGLTYHDVASSLGISEASVKRLFSEKSFSLVRFAQICQLMDMEISDLVKLVEAESRTLDELTEEQERELVADIKLLVVAYLVVNHWSFSEIVSHFELAETEVIHYLAVLDGLKLIQLLPRNHIKLLISSHFAWRKNGPIQQFFKTHLQNEFFNSSFIKEDESFVFLSSMLSRASNQIMIKKLERLAIEFEELNQEDRRLPLEERFAYSLILAVRPWRPSVFEKLQK